MRDKREIRGTRYVTCNACREAEHQARLAEIERERLRKLEEAAEIRRSRIADYLQGAGVNVWEHGEATLDNFDTSESGPVPLEAARQFVADVKAADKYTPVRGLYLFGTTTGSGKSHLAVAVAREILCDAKAGAEDVVFDNSLRLIGEIQRTYSSNESADAVLNRRINAGVWILDDLGTEAPSADVVRRLTEIFTARAMRPTLVTSNLPPDKLETRHAELFRVVSRLGPRYFRTVQVKGSDRRFRAA